MAFFKEKILPQAARLLIAALKRSMRIRYVHAEHMDALLAAKKPFVMAFWHNQLLMMVYGYRGERRNISPVISRHRDGGYIAAVMDAFGHGSVRGSSTRGGASALRESVRLLREGRSVAFTPDGPRGPRHEAQPGAVQAARLAGVPVLPVAFTASKKKSSPAGTVLRFPCRSRAGFFSMESLSMFPEKLARRAPNPSACAWSTNSACCPSEPTRRSDAAWPSAA